MQKLDNHSENIIASHGWMTQYVFPVDKNGGPSFSYTIGLADAGLPELIVVALPAEIAHMMITAIIEKLREEQAGGPTVLGAIDINFNFPAYVREVSVEDVADYATRAIFRSEGKAKFRQISIPDRTGKFPWESGFSGDPKMYPILGTAPV